MDAGATNVLHLSAAMVCDKIPVGLKQELEIKCFWE